MKRQLSSSHFLITTLILGTIIVACDVRFHRDECLIKFKENRIEIHPPGVKLSTDDEAAIKEILSATDSSLYKIQPYDKGKLKETQGDLADWNTQLSLFVEVGKELTLGHSYYAAQFGNKTYRTGKMTTSETESESSPPPPQPSGSPSHTYHHANKDGESDSVELVNKLRPILEKYCRQSPSAK